MFRRDSGVKSEPTTPKSDEVFPRTSTIRPIDPIDHFLSTRNLIEPNFIEIRNHIDKQHAYLYSVAVQRFRYAEKFSVKISMLLLRNSAILSGWMSSRNLS